MTSTAAPLPPSDRLRILFVGDAVVSSGFARCTHAACDELHAAGHEVHVLGMNYWGDPHQYPYLIYPCFQPLEGGRDYGGTGRIAKMVTKLEPDVVVILNDPWSVPGYTEELKRIPETVKAPIVIGWLAVDSCNQPGYMLNDLDHVAVWTEFGAAELKRGGYKGETSVVPLGVDLSVFYRRDREVSRVVVLPPHLDIPHDSFIVGCVGRNQQRKRLDLTLRYFAKWIEKYGIDNAHLYIHTAPTGDVGAHIPSLVRYYGLKGRVVENKPYVGFGESDDHLAHLYSAFDVYVTTSQAEGWGLPALEAMACGTPCILPDFAAFSHNGGWPPLDSCVRVQCPTTSLTGPMNLNGAYTVGGIPDEHEFIAELNSMYKSEIHRRTFGRRGPRAAEKFPHTATGRIFRSMIETVVASLRVPSVVELGLVGGPQRIATPEAQPTERTTEPTPPTPSTATTIDPTTAESNQDAADGAEGVTAGE